MRTWLPALVAIVLAGCASTSHQGRFGVLSTKTFPTTEGREVTGSACTLVFFGVQTDPGYLQRAMDEALKKAGPDYDVLVNTSIGRGGLSVEHWRNGRLPVLRGEGHGGAVGQAAGDDGRGP